MSEQNRTDPVSLPKAWPFEEAAKLAAHVEGKAGPADAPALLETGYGPSGLPHIGTFGEVARTSWVCQAYTRLTGRPTRLLAFSDDMDALRKVPDNVPNGDMLRQHLGKPLSRIPDPFGTHESFAAHNNARLRSFLDGFGFTYEFASSTDYYTGGLFDAALRRVLEVHDEIVAVIAPTLGPDRRATYSPVLPIHPRTGMVMQVRMDAIDPAAGTVRWTDDDGTVFETPVTGGHAKMQWKADWAMRWFALGVDYEMSGKDLIDSVKLSGKICRILGGQPPAGLTYELFLDENGQKISKSKGNGISVEEWLRYAPPESLGQYMFNAPQRAKRLFFDVIPKAADEYLANVARAQALPDNDPALLSNPAWFIHGGPIGADAGSPLTFGMLLNLASVANAETPDVLWKFIRRYDAAASPETCQLLARLVDHAIVYYADFVRPAKTYRQPDARERAALSDLADSLRGLADGPSDPDTLQNLVFEIGKRHGFEPLRTWFGCLYEVLLGQTEGPRFGIFIGLYGVAETVALIEAALLRPSVEAPAGGAG
ncbi:lysyl-tRNA synthetase [Gluconacetobacter diazotrophicus PA1 5]|uniref:Lysine--tRNA ligase n=1 Tax=Gluconacetobacter diazotrophicus (strain ATCC 49037 / DSM 5601 / CCUG 37298 / CIP 103539 / LMG 7603 / PAl5) TaxID=272568 RepID=A9HK29_GLUDA|nr:lysine--tRNA ligase [Gluconacetobacter diazotrophicus]ACI50065.1 lysyl-tRNA synthetase [Gluconacetobacter diazotrophicus PA1 5]TWB07855.1 lysyl-tRNA synthetase class I [Gluconacetobacter diazotrophicus]CAP55989.1 putative Lysyl-tRNA synthetase [Gluconacetobacter diazotrophicus PA1 5]